MTNILDVLLYFIWRPEVLKKQTFAGKGNGQVTTNVHSSSGYSSEPLRIEDDPTVWAPVTMTLVEYPENDFLGYVYAWTSLIPLVIIVGFITLIIFRRDLWTVTFFGLLMVDEIINKILKRIIKSPRPLIRKDVYGKYGMPSSHAQFMGFFTAYLILFICLRQKQTYRKTLMKCIRNLLVMGIAAVNLVVCISRVYLSYHSALQVFVGQLIGIGFGTFSFFMVVHFVVPLFPKIVAWNISEFFLLRDTTLIPNVLLFEYAIIRQETRARSRQIKNKKATK